MISILITCVFKGVCFKEPLLTLIKVCVMTTKAFSAVDQVFMKHFAAFSLHSRLSGVS